MAPRAVGITIPRESVEQRQQIGAAFGVVNDNQDRSTESAQPVEPVLARILAEEAGDVVAPTPPPHPLDRQPCLADSTHGVQQADRDGAE